MTLSTAPEPHLVGQLTAGTLPERLQAFTELWVRYQPQARVVASRYVAYEQVDDVLQDVFIAVNQAINNGKGPGENPQSYFYSAIKHRSLRFLDQQRSYMLVEEDALQSMAPSSPSADEEADEPDVDDAYAVAVLGAYQKLSSRQQQLIWMADVDEYPVNTIAQQTGQSPNTVSAALMRARRAIRKNFITAYAARSTNRAVCTQMVNRFDQYLEGSLNENRHAELEAHLAECADCRSRLREVQQLGVKLKVTALPLLVGGAALWQDWVHLWNVPAGVPVNATVVHSAEAQPSEVTVAGGVHEASRHKALLIWLLVFLFAAFIALAVLWPLFAGGDSSRTANTVNTSGAHSTNQEDPQTPVAPTESTPAAEPSPISLNSPQAGAAPGIDVANPAPLSSTMLGVGQLGEQWWTVEVPSGLNQVQVVISGRNIDRIDMQNNRWLDCVYGAEVVCAPQQPGAYGTVILNAGGSDLLGTEILLTGRDDAGRDVSYMKRWDEISEVSPSSRSLTVAWTGSLDMQFIGTSLTSCDDSIPECAKVLSGEPSPAFSDKVSVTGRPGHLRPSWADELVAAYAFWSATGNPASSASAGVQLGAGSSSVRDILPQDFAQQNDPIVGSVYQGSANITEQLRSSSGLWHEVSVSHLRTGHDAYGGAGMLIVSAGTAQLDNTGMLLLYDGFDLIAAGGRWQQEVPSVPAGKNVRVVGMLYESDRHLRGGQMQLCSSQFSDDTFARGQVFDGEYRQYSIGIDTFDLVTATCASRQPMVSVNTLSDRIYLGPVAVQIS